MVEAEAEKEPDQKRDIFIEDVKARISARFSLTGMPGEDDRIKSLNSLGELVYNARSLPANGGVIVCVNPEGFFVIGITLSQKPEGRYSQKGEALRLSSTMQKHYRAHKIRYVSIADRIGNNESGLNGFLSSNKASLIEKF